MKNKILHIPVLLNEVIEALHVTPSHEYIDCTLGAGGHSEEILKKGGKLLGIEADITMLNIAKERLKVYCPTLLQGNFSNVSKIAKENGFLNVSGILMDLGVSSYHYSTLNRGFSIKELESDLDMRLDPLNSSITAANLLNILPFEKLVALFEEVLGDRVAKKVARIVVFTREKKHFEKVSDLVKVMYSNLPEVFLALRMAVNDEINVLERGVEGAIQTLNSGGSLVVISFHSVEDKTVLRLTKNCEERGIGLLVTKKPIIPSDKEILENPKSRSALMRIFKKL